MDQKKSQKPQTYVSPEVIERIKNIQEEVWRDFRGVDVSHTGRPGMFSQFY